MTRLFWIGDTHETLTRFPDTVRKEIGFVLFCEEIATPGIHLKRDTRTIASAKPSREPTATRLGQLRNLRHDGFKKIRKRPLEEPCSGCRPIGRPTIKVVEQGPDLIAASGNASLVVMQLG